MCSMVDHGLEEVFPNPLLGSSIFSAARERSKLKDS
jgi:hypothetical protein